ncbi:MAG: hypothetical protein PHG82_05555 [Candidatus Gracilibacteria bacterium]|nr:hypothetical protein [Candidatus Gracilibacteria bacterium]
MTATQNNDDLLIVSDEVKTEDNDFLFFDTPTETKEEAIISFDVPEASTEIQEDSSIDFGFSFDTPSEAKEEISFEEIKEDDSMNFFSMDATDSGILEEKEEEILDETPSFLMEEAKEVESEAIIAMPELSMEVTDKMSSVVGDLNSILDETISKLELRKTNLFALKDSKSINIEDLNKQIAELKAKVKDLESEVKSLESEDEQIVTNITALQSMKLGEAVNNKDYKKTTKKVA